MRGAHTGASPVRRPPTAWKKLIPYAIGAAILLAIVAGLRPKPIEVETAAVSIGPLTVTVLEEGKTRIRHRYVISPPMSGFLNRIELRAGDPIEAGKTVLAIIQAEPSGFLTPRARAEAEARVKAAEAMTMRRESELERARSALELAEKEKQRMAELKRKGAIAEREWDAAENQAVVLAREVRTAEFAQQVANFELTQAEAALVQAQSPAPEHSEPFKILAPVSGYVLNVFEESARNLVAGTPILEVGDPNDLEAEIELLSSDAVAVHAGAEVSIEQWGGGKPLRAKVSVVEPGGFTKISALGVEEQRVKVRVEFVDPIPADRKLGDRFRVEARIITWSESNVLQVPTGALFRRGNDWMTFAVDRARAKLTKVEIGHQNGVAAEVLVGLSKGQAVILHPPDGVADEAAIKPRAGK
ncbi:MAG: HlyD family efflux transporter periplasmic adaptor subunit [Verrucomicrobiota bacterium]|nr:HlyD family efflux transporter periplasmic adaptor subunit [Verrucomicrobiota bacterium]